MGNRTFWSICPLRQAWFISAGRGWKRRSSINEFSAKSLITISVLKTLGAPSSSFGGLLGARLIKLIPSGLQLEWAKSATNKATDIGGVNKLIGEHDAAERFNQISSTEKSKIFSCSYTIKTSRITSNKSISTFSMIQNQFSSTG